MWIDCSTCAEIGEPGRLGELAVREQHVVLRIARCDEASLLGAIARLADELPEHTVFRSGERTITVLRVIDRAEIARRSDDIRGAIAAYRASCTRLVAEYEAGTLAREWHTDEHGSDCRFQHEDTGQIVEAPLGGSPHVDPSFFAEFVKSTPAWATVAALLVDDFHDAARMLEVVGVVP